MSDAYQEDDGMNVAVEMLKIFVSARATAVNAMTRLEIACLRESDAYQAAMNLDSDMQRLMHGRFEV